MNSTGSSRSTMGDVTESLAASASAQLLELQPATMILDEPGGSALGAAPSIATKLRPQPPVACYPVGSVHIREGLPVKGTVLSTPQVDPRAAHFYAMHAVYNDTLPAAGVEGLTYAQRLEDAREWVAYMQSEGMLPPAFSLQFVHRAADNILHLYCASHEEVQELQRHVAAWEEAHPTDETATHAPMNG